MTLGFILSNKTLPDNLDYDRKDIHKIVRGIRREAMKQLRYLGKAISKNKLHACGKNRISQTCDEVG